MKHKSKISAFLLCLFLGLFGIHRFYLGRWPTGLLMFLTAGGLGIWWLLDSILVATGVIRDVDGSPLRTGPPGTENPAAGFWVRMAAFSVDMIILHLIIGATALAVTPPIVIGFMDTTDAGAQYMLRANQPFTIMLISSLTVLAIVLMLFYFGIQHASSNRATIGKLCFDIEVHTDSGGQLTLLRAMWRAFAYLISMIPLCLGFVMAAISQDKRALHDLLAGTEVRYVTQRDNFVREYAPALDPRVAPALSAKGPAPTELPVEKRAEGAGTALIVIGALLLAAAAAAAWL